MYSMAAGTMTEKSLETQNANQANSSTKEEMACTMCSYETTCNSVSVFLFTCVLILKCKYMMNTIH